MAVASTMSQSRRPPGPPPGPPPSRTNARPPPPPPPRAPGRGRPTEFVGRSGLPGGKKRSSDETSHNNPRKKMSVSIMAPVVLRDVTAFEKKQQVGQGTYGSVFMGADKQSGEIVALKRINTEQEENGFPLTALREVKILKALNHVNIVELKEIVTSKGEFTLSVLMLLRACLNDGKADTFPGRSLVLCDLS